jgi:hypothetical protein
MNSIIPWIIAHQHDIAHFLVPILLGVLNEIVLRNPKIKSNSLYQLAVAILKKIAGKE